MREERRAINALMNRLPHEYFENEHSIRSATHLKEEEYLLILWVNHHVY